MTDDEAKALGLRAVVCPGWRWLPGMLPVDGYRVLAVFGSALFSLVADRDPGRAGFVDSAAAGPPDFRDAATMGAAIALWQARPGHDYRCPCPVLTYAAVYGLTDRRTIEALVAALEAAPARVQP